MRPWNKNAISHTERALAKREVLAVMAVVTILATILFLHRAREKDQVARANCAHHLEHIGRSFNLWAGSHDHLYPMAFYLPAPGETNATDDLSPLLYFRAMSNELRFASILDCPADAQRHYATNFTSDLDRSHLSYFTGLDARASLPKSFLAGDRNISNGTTISNDILTLTSKPSAYWSGELHDGWGNVALADGSVLGVNTRQLNNALAQTGLATNRLLLP